MHIFPTVLLFIGVKNKMEPVFCVCGVVRVSHCLVRCEYSRFTGLQFYTVGLQFQSESEGIKEGQREVLFHIGLAL